MSKPRILYLLELCTSLYLAQLILLLQQVESSSSCHGAVRLVNGANAHEGRVEICIHGTWNTVCGNDLVYGNSEASTVCAQLGYSHKGARAVTLNGAAFGQGTGSILEVHCGHTRKRITDCNITYGYCSHRQDAGVRCLSCQHGEVRLQGSRYPYAGRVEVCINGEWGTVCDDHWNAHDATVVCKQLGFSRFGSWGYHGASYDRATGRIPMHDVRCMGNEERLIDCRHRNSTVKQDCTHDKDASVICQPTLLCQTGDIRLQGGKRKNEGRVEICINETWGTICDRTWGQSHARTVCTLLGYSNQGARQSIFGSGSNSVHFNNVQCFGRYCSYQGTYSTGTCFYFYIAGVQCNFDTLPSVIRFQATIDNSNLCTLSWQPPNITKRHGTIQHYLVSCSTEDDKLALRDAYNQTVLMTLTSISIGLQPYQFYNCCVAAVNEVGRGTSSCQTVITHEAAPTASPTTIEAHKFNSTSVFLSWRPPLAQYWNGIIQGYHVNFTQANRTNSDSEEYTTVVPYLLINNLEPGVMYTFRVAAYTVGGKGPFSELMDIVPSLNFCDQKDYYVPVTVVLSSVHNQVLITTVRTLLIALTVIIGVSGCLAILICYKMITWKKQKRCPVCNVYQTVKGCEAIHTLQAGSDPTAMEDQHAIAGRSGTCAPLIQPKTYYRSVSLPLDKTDNLESLKLQDLDQNLMMDSENTLIPPWHSHNNTTASEY